MKNMILLSMFTFLGSHFIFIFIRTISQHRHLLVNSFVYVQFLLSGIALGVDRAHNTNNRGSVAGKQLILGKQLIIVILAQIIRYDSIPNYLNVRFSLVVNLITFVYLTSGTQLSDRPISHCLCTCLIF